MAQVPPVTVVAVKPDAAVPDTVHTRWVLELNETGCSELAVAVRGNRVWTGLSGSGPKLIFCPRFVTVNDCVTSGAGAQYWLPPWVAVMAQVPPVTVLAVKPDAAVPDTVHTRWVLELNETGCSELAVAVKANWVLTATSGSGPKLIV
jgi:hypothetical protein